MKLCPRCNISKPDANFYVDGKRNSRVVKRCLQCRKGRFGAKSTMIPAERPRYVPHLTLAERLAIFRARKELARFRERGSPEIERPYCRLPSGYLPSRQLT